MRKLLRAILPVAIVLPLLLLSWSVMTRTANAANNPDWAGNPRLDGAGDLVVRLLNGSLKEPTNQGSACAAEASTSGNVQVNCLAEDGASPQNTQSETSVAAFGSKVVVGFNDSLVSRSSATNLSQHSLSADDGKSCTDMVDVAFKSTVQPTGDPAVEHDA